MTHTDTHWAIVVDQADGSPYFLPDTRRGGRWITANRDEADRAAAAALADNEEECRDSSTGTKTFHVVPSKPRVVTPGARSAGAYALTELITNYSRHIAWQARCAAYSLAKAAGESPDEPDVKKMPNKAAKHRMYEQASRVRALLDLAVDRPTTLAGIGLVISAAMEVV